MAILLLFLSFMILYLIIAIGMIFACNRQKDVINWFKRKFKKRLYPYEIMSNLKPDEFDTIHNWLKEDIKGKYWFVLKYYAYYADYDVYEFCFRYEEDLMAFKLRCL